MDKRIMEAISHLANFTPTERAEALVELLEVVAAVAPGDAQEMQERGRFFRLILCAMVNGAEIGRRYPDRLLAAVEAATIAGLLNEM